MKCWLAGLLFLVGAAVISASADPQVIRLWPGDAPGETQPLGEERDTTTAEQNKIAGKRVMRIGNVAQSSITVFLPPKEKANGAGVLVCPGGGYHILAWDLEGTEVAEWLNSKGIAAFVLKYRVPVRKDRERHAAPLQDAQRAMGLIRQRAQEFGVDPKRLGVLGFSAGAHLSAALGSHESQERTYDRIDAADELSSRPAFVVLVYPGYLADKQGNIPPELKVSQDTPPTFIVQTQDDPIPIEGALAYFGALKKQKVPGELHIYASGGHGYGLRASEEPVTQWPKLVERWLEGLKVTSATR